MSKSFSSSFNPFTARGGGGGGNIPTTHSYVPNVPPNLLVNPDTMASMKITSEEGTLIVLGLIEFASVIGGPNQQLARDLADRMNKLMFEKAPLALLPWQAVGIGQAPSLQQQGRQVPDGCPHCGYRHPPDGGCV